MHTKIARHILLALTSLAALVAVVALPAGGAHAQTACSIAAAYQGSATFSASVASAAPGSTVVFNGSGWPPNSNISITVNGVNVGTATTNAAGQFSFSYTFPSTSSGTQTVSAGCGAFVLSQSVTMTTTNSVTPITTRTGTLPVTGSPAVGIAQVALVILAVGGLLVLVARRRSSAKS